MPRCLDIYVLGAGASYVHGAPQTNEILPYALNQLPDGSDNRLAIVRQFLSDVFAFDHRPETLGDRYPNLVDVLSVVDMALDRRENLARGYDLEHLRGVRRALEYAIFKVLEHSLSPATSSQSRQSQATRRLVSKVDRATTAFISMNYDVIIDLELAREYNGKPMRQIGADAGRFNDVFNLGIDYGLEFSNIDRDALGAHPFNLLKLHGSFNWLWSRVTGNVYFGGLNKSVKWVLDLDKYYDEDSPLEFEEPLEVLEPMLITPTHLKDLRNVHLATLWRKAEQALREARKVTFIGYSLPSDDLHVKFLLKRAFETGRNGRPSIVVVDLAKEGERTPVQKNYENFFGRDVEYHRNGFDDYVTNMRETRVIEDA